MTVYIFDLRGLDKPTHTTPAKTGGLPRPHYSTNAEQRRRRAAAREAGGIDRIVLHQWAAEVEPPAQAGDHGDALVLACRAAGLSFYGTSRGIGGAPYHISVSATRRAPASSRWSGRGTSIPSTREQRTRGASASA